jgi:hypothetical protein
MKGNIMTVKKITKKYLEEHGFDGLGGDCCGCALEDLMSCDYGQCSGCIPAYQYEPIKEAETNCPDFMKCETQYDGCLYIGDFDSVLSEDDRQCACRYKRS